MNIVKYIKSLDDSLYGKGVAEKEIEKCENLLNVKFSEEYREYLMELGSAEVNCSELTGITNVERLNVVNVTKQNCNDNKSRNDVYVVHETNIDGIVIWQDQKGIVYETRGSNDLEKICDSLMQYIQEYCE